jgi:nucleoid-associated protein EbfC
VIEENDTPPRRQGVARLGARVYHATANSYRRSKVLTDGMRIFVCARPPYQPRARIPPVKKYDRWYHASKREPGASQCKLETDMNIMQVMKQAQELQAKMQQAQTELETLEVEGQAAAGAVVVRMSGKGDLRGLKIDPALLKPEDSDILEDLIIAAHKDARGKADAVMQERMKQVTGGLPLPPGMKLF